MKNKIKELIKIKQILESRRNPTESRRNPIPESRRNSGIPESRVELLRRDRDTNDRIVQSIVNLNCKPIHLTEERVDEFIRGGSLEEFVDSIKLNTF